ncbi:MAG: hypothetical protein KGQ54_05675 [Verrucomicrobia bacterium]|nr:hypothetical protein [Verrucomicrobiota bacterium]
MGEWTSGALNSKYSLPLNHGGAYWDVKDGRHISDTPSVSWAIGKKHHPDKPIPSAIYKALRAAPMNTLTLGELIVITGISKITNLQGYLRELNKQRIITMVDDGTA